MSANFQAVGTYTPDHLIAGNSNLLLARKVTIASGQNLPRGALLGKITASGKYVQSASAASDGSQTPDLILSEATDATGADTAAVAYSRGDFNVAAVTLGTGHTVASVQEGLRSKGINLLASIT